MLSQPRFGTCRDFEHIYVFDFKNFPKKLIIEKPFILFLLNLRIEPCVVEQKVGIFFLMTTIVIMSNAAKMWV